MAFLQTQEAFAVAHPLPGRDADYLRACYKYAEHFSHDPKTKNGALLLTTDGKIYYGTNHFPGEIKPTPEMLVPEIKDPLIIHAEEDCILAAAHGGSSTEGAKMYCCWAPCVHCASAILTAGVMSLTTHKQMHDKTYPKYVESIQRAIGYLVRAQVEYRMYDGPIGDCVGRMFNEDWLP